VELAAFYGAVGSADAGPHADAGDAQLRHARCLQRRDWQDSHSVLVDYDVFVNVPQMNAQDPVNGRRWSRARAWTSAYALAQRRSDRGVFDPERHRRLHWCRA
jgi:hypothetical protein